MLVLSRKIEEAIVIGDNIRITVISIQGDRVRLGIAAPRDVAVDRQEIHDRKHAWTDSAPAPEVSVVS